VNDVVVIEMTVELGRKRRFHIRSVIPQAERLLCLYKIGSIFFSPFPEIKNREARCGFPVWKLW